MKIQTQISVAILWFVSFACSAYGNLLPSMIEIERYLNSVQTMSAKFIQISATGKVETGIIFFKNLQNPLGLKLILTKNIPKIMNINK